ELVTPPSQVFHSLYVLIARGETASEFDTQSIVQQPILTLERAAEPGNGVTIGRRLPDVQIQNRAADVHRLEFESKISAQQLQPKIGYKHRRIAANKRRTVARHA